MSTKLFGAAVFIIQTMESNLYNIDKAHRNTLLTILSEINRTLDKTDINRQIF